MSAPRVKKELLVLVRLSTAIVAVLFFHSLSSCAFYSEIDRTGDINHQRTSIDAVKRIEDIENGLLPPVIVKGQTIPRMTIVDRMKFYKVPGVSIAFIESGKIIWTRTYGVANTITNRPVTPETLFQAGSISKPVSALAALKLVQEGKLNLDEDINRKLRTWKVPENQFTQDQKVTLRRILSHTAGLTVSGFFGYASDEYVPTITQILNGESPANNPPIRVDTVPGTLWRYSGGGYVILQVLLTDVTGKTYPQILHDLVLQPIGMTHSTFQQPLPKSLTSSAAIPYGKNGEPIEGGAHSYPEMGPAGLWTTPTDLARLAIEVQKEYAGISNKILSKAMMNEMLTRQIFKAGLGFRIEAPGHQPQFGHGGKTAGFESELEAYRGTESEEGFVIMTNSDNDYQLIEEIRRAMAKEYNWADFQPIEYTQVTIDPKLFDGYLGHYQLEPGVIITVTREGNHLFIQRSGEQKQEVFAESDSRFFVKTSDLEFAFVIDSHGRAIELVVGGRQHAKRIGEGGSQYEY